MGHLSEGGILWGSQKVMVPYLPYKTHGTFSWQTEPNSKAASLNAGTSYSMDDMHTVTQHFVKRAIAVPFPTGAQGGHYFPNLTTHSGVVWYLPLHAKTFSRSALTSPCSSSLAPLTHLCSPHHFFRDTWEYRNRNGTNWYWSAQNLWHFSKKKNKNKTINQ